MTLSTSGSKKNDLRQILVKRSADEFWTPLKITETDSLFADPLALFNQINLSLVLLFGPMNDHRMPFLGNELACYSISPLKVEAADVKPMLSIFKTRLERGFDRHLVGFIVTREADGGAEFSLLDKDAYSGLNNIIFRRCPEASLLVDLSLCQDAGNRRLIMARSSAELEW